jgi:pimeloyl-ACP methyl ester carboxylesterase
VHNGVGVYSESEESVNSWMAAAARITVAFVSSGLCATSTAQSPRAGTFRTPGRPSFMRPCKIPNISGEALCGKFEVYEVRQAKQGRKIQINIQILPAMSSTRQPDPLVFLAGPGGGATAYTVFANQAFEKIRETRDLVFVDQRGTGESNPLLCDVYGTAREGFFADLFPIEAIQACRKEWETRADLRFYTTYFAVANLDQIRAALGYSQLNLFGTSYGTRVAQAYLRSFPANVRAVILKGATPMAQTWVRSIASDAQRALDLVFQDCEADEACRAAYPNLRREFADVLGRFEKGKVQAEVANRATGVAENVVISRDAFVTTLRSVLQGAYTAAQVPLLIHQAARGDFAPWAGLVRSLRTNSPVGSGSFLTIINSEDLPRTDAQEVGRLSDGTFMGEYYYRQLVRACRGLPKAPMPEEFFAPVRSDAPVLLISGFRDPATPPQNAEEIARFLPNSLHLVVRYGGHSYGGFSPCVDSLMAQFIATGTAKGLDTSCLGGLRQIPFRVPTGLAGR